MTAFTATQLLMASVFMAWICLLVKCFMVIIPVGQATAQQPQP